MLTAVLSHARRAGHHLVDTLLQRLAIVTKPSSQRLVVETRADLPRSKPQLLAENALLRQQLLILPLDFLQYLSSPRVSAPVAAEVGTIPTYKGFKPPDPGTALINDLVTHPTINGTAEATLGPEWLKDRIATMQAYLTGQETLDQALADMQRYTDQAANCISQIYHLGA
jgi:hypothetical protein